MPPNISILNIVTYVECIYTFHTDKSFWLFVIHLHKASHKSENLFSFKILNKNLMKAIFQLTHHYRFFFLVLWLSRQRCHPPRCSAFSLILQMVYYAPKVKNE